MEKNRRERLREELHALVDLYGTSDKRTLKKSEELDEVLVQEARSVKAAC